MDFDCLQKVEGSRKDHDLVLFALSTCGWCRKAREFLDRNDVAYRYVYVDLLEGDEQNAILEEAFRWNPNRNFPTLVIDENDVVVGFNESAYKEKVL